LTLKYCSKNRKLLQSVHSADLRAKFRYYVGSMPFILGLLYFIGDMSRNAFAGQYCAIASFGLTLLFIWMKCWQAHFTSLLRAHISGQPPPALSFAQTFHLSAQQAAIHSTGFIVLPVALVLMLPYAWCYAFYQNVTAQAFTSDNNLVDACRRAWQQALLWPRQNHFMITIMSLFGAVVYANIAVATFILPYAIKRFIGIDTVFTLTGTGVINTTFVAVTMGIAYLCLDPIIKAAYMLRCYYGNALKTGADLQTQLARIKKVQSIAVAAVMLIICLTPVHLEAKPVGDDRSSGNAAGRGPVTPAELNRSIDHVLQQREFAWRLPRHEDDALSPEDKPGPLVAALNWVVKKIIEGVEWLWRQLERFAGWIDRLWPVTGGNKKEQSTTPRISAKTLLILLLIGVACGALYFVLKNWRRSRQAQLDEPIESIQVEPDLNDESIKADALPVQRWLEMAGRLQQKGSFRLAMRALYLATLSHLADREYITIQNYKSNWEYQRELARRASDQPIILKAFAKMVTVFDQIWYGLHSASEQDYQKYFAIHRDIMGGARAI